MGITTGMGTGTIAGTPGYTRANAYSSSQYALLELATEAIRRRQLEDTGSPKLTLQYPPLEAFVADEDIPS